MARTIRTCSVAALAAAVLVSQPAVAKRDEPSALSHYVAARVLDSANASAEAAAAYARALTAAPDSERVAARAYREAVEAGDKALALRAARALEVRQRLPQDARLLLFSDTLARGDWRGARLWLDRIEEADGFEFLAPALRAWTFFAARDGDPLAEPESLPRDGLGSVYLREQRTLLLLALKQVDEGLAAAKAQTRVDGRGLTLRLAAAARLVALKERAKALELLGGDDPAIRAARALVEAGKPLPGAVDTATSGTALLIARVASDLIRDTASPASLTLARLASFAAPSNDAVKLTLAQTLANNGRAEEALTVLDTVGPPFVPAVREIRIATLQRMNRHEEALAQAQLAVALPDASLFDYARLGDAHTRLKHYGDAAEAYREAIGRSGQDAPWNLWLLYGGVLDQADDWAKARPALERAVAVGPDQPAALNHLGYAMLEHGEDLIEATRLIAKASSLRPDDAAITDSLGWAFYLRGEHDQSIPLLERAVAAEPTDAALGEHLGDAYWAAGRRMDARYAWRAALIQSEAADVTKRIESKIADGLPARRK